MTTLRSRCRIVLVGQFARSHASQRVSEEYNYDIHIGKPDVEISTLSGSVDRYEEPAHRCALRHSFRWGVVYLAMRKGAIFGDVVVSNRYPRKNIFKWRKILMVCYIFSIFIWR
jgi:hypothetical protein